jgi:hypothetical protein
VRFRILAIAALVFAIAPVAAAAQALPSMSSVSVAYNTRKTTVRPEGDLKVQIDALDQEIAAARRFGRTGELRRLYAKGMTLLAGRPWTDDLDFANALVLRTDRLVVDPLVRAVRLGRSTPAALPASADGTSVDRAALGIGAALGRSGGSREGLASSTREPRSPRSPLRLDLDLTGIAMAPIARRRCG